MTHTCDDCGEELDPDRDKSRGRYRDRCLPCILDAAPDDPPHVETCTEPECLVCRDHREEFGPTPER